MDLSRRGLRHRKLSPTAGTDTESDRNRVGGLDAVILRQGWGEADLDRSRMLPLEQDQALFKLGAQLQQRLGSDRTRFWIVAVLECSTMSRTCVCFDERCSQER